MSSDFQRIPIILLLGALVPIFWFLYRETRSYRVRVWSLAWSVILLRACVQVLGPALGMREAVVNGLDLGALQLAGILLLVSVSRTFEEPAQRWPFFLSTAVPSVLYAELFAFGTSHSWLFLVAGCVLFASICGWTLRYYRLQPRIYMLGIAAVSVACVTWGTLYALRGRADLGFYSIDAFTFAITGFMFWHWYRRFSPGVVLTCTGLFAWAAVFPAFYLLETGNPVGLALLTALSNLPKFWVAIGMIVTVMEDQSQRARLLQVQERATREQIQRFFHVTSRLLSGADVESLCDEVARVITESSIFQRALIMLTDEQRRLCVAGAAAFDLKLLEEFRPVVQQTKVDAVEHLCETGDEIGPHSFSVGNNELEQLGWEGLMRQPTHVWNVQSGCVLVPLLSPRGLIVGCMLLDGPRDDRRIAPEDLAAIELLSTDIAISIENSHLQRQLVVSEKLAGLGKLVSGAGHELNNPLTAVLGYSEMLSLSVQDESSRRGAEIIRREALRMKSIIDSLLRFARQTPFAPRAIALPTLLNEVLALRAYDVKRRAIALHTDFEGLPEVLGDESLLKQVFLNILNNSLDALQGVTAPEISILAKSEGRKVEVRVSDNGPGFADIDRVFDPFFTTKDLGKGPGLGLSVSYGIVKQHGGDIRAHQLQPRGACITVELLAATEALDSREASLLSQSE